METEKPSIFSRLSFDLIREILLYDEHYVIRKNNPVIPTQIVCIQRIPKSDIRFQLRIPKIFETHPNCWNTILGQNKRFVVGRRITTITQEWEYFFLTFSRDIHMNMFQHIPDSTLYLPLV